MTTVQRWHLNDGALRARINEGGLFRSIGQDPFRDPAKRARFDLMRSEFLRLQDQSVQFEVVPPTEGSTNDSQAMNKHKTAGWESLNCPFFAAACRRILSDYLETQGFVEKELTPVGGIVYQRFDVFLEISYEPEACPDFSPAIVLGIGPGKYDEGGRPGGVPFWYVIPNNLSERSYTFWTFKTKADLESVLLRIKEAIIEPHAKPLWLNLDRLEKYITNFRAEF